jgi:DNA-binding beta-propeller fold protein YncE
MRSLAIAVVAVLVLGFIATPVVPQPPQPKDDSLTGEYEVVPNWPRPWAKEGYIWGSQSSVFAETENRVYIAVRGELKLPEELPAGFPGFWGALGERAITARSPDSRNVIVVVDATGKMIESWTQWDHLWAENQKTPNSLLGPHSIKISPYDPERHVWVIDESGDQVLEFSHDGKQLVMTLGEKGVPGNDDKHFGQPQDIAWLPDGSFFIADGTGNSRVAKFDKDGKFLMAWGKKGNGTGDFNTVHAVATDRQHHVYVADRGNHRIQVFDENGKYLSQWPDILFPDSILVTANQDVWVADGGNGYTPAELAQHTRFLKFTTSGRLMSWWGAYGSEPGTFWEPHAISVDPQGNFYVADSYEGRTQKFRPKPHADKSLLVGTPDPLMGH